MTFKFSEFNDLTNDDSVLNSIIRLSLDLPTLILISVFSAFSYYLSRLNLEVETILHQMDEPNASGHFNSRALRPTGIRTERTGD